METNRLIFKDVDNSASLPQPGVITGYTVLRAPKGTTKPQFIQQGDTTSILNLFGAPSSKYPAIQEALDFNAGYGLWISAPPGTHSGLVNYYDGCYVTTLGSLEPFEVPFGVVQTNGVGEDMTGVPAVDYCINTSSSNLGVAFATPTATSGSPFITGSNITVVPSTGIIIDNIPLANFDHSMISSLVISGNAGHAITAFSYTFGYNPSGGSGAGWYNQTSLGVFGSVRFGIESTGTLGANYVKITFIAPPADPTCPQITQANLTTATGAASPIPNTYTITWNQNIGKFVIASFYQSSIRSTPGTFTLSSVDNTPFSVQLGSATNITFTTPILATPLTATFTVSSVAGATAGSIIVAGTVVNLVSGDISTVSGVAAKIAAAFTGAWVGSNISGAVTITSAVPILQDSRANVNFNTAIFSYQEASYGTSTYVKTNVRVSTDPNKVDGSGNSLYIGNVIGTNNYVQGSVNTLFARNFSDLTVPWVSASDTFTGSRIVSNSQFSLATDLATTLQPGWDQSGGPDYADVSIYLDGEYDISVANNMANARNYNNKFATYVTGIRVANVMPTSSADLQAAVNAIILARSSMPNLTGLTYYCNEFQVTENYTGTTYWTIPTGSMALMLANIMDQRLGGAAPMWTNENGLGGQITKSVKRQKFAFNANQLDQLDAAAINPIVLDNFYGLMATSQRTAQSGTNITDWSFLGHSMSFDLFKKEMKYAVMIPQLGKAIDPYHMALRGDQTQIILNKRIKGPNAIWADGKVYIETVNTPDTKTQKTFVIKVRVKVNAFSEYVELIFNNIGQSDTP
jgi:hypothetical protein